MNLAKFDSLRGYIMTSISEVEHAPEYSIGVGFGYLDERKLGRICRREGEFIDCIKNAGVDDGPFEIP